MSDLNPKKLTDDYFVISQIQPSDLTEIQKMGFQTVLNNRPDNEEADQPSKDLIEEATTAAGLAYYYLPIVSGIDSQTSKAFLKIMAEAPKPILAFCRTGTRCTHLWAESIQSDLKK